MDLLARFQTMPVVELQRSEGMRTGQRDVVDVDEKTAAKLVKRHGIVDARVTFPADLHAGARRVLVLAGRRLVGYLGPDDAAKYAPMLREFQDRGHRLQVPGQIVAGFRKMHDFGILVRLPTDPDKLRDWLPGAA